jgi:hypothetical protein
MLAYEQSTRRSRGVVLPMVVIALALTGAVLAALYFSGGMALLTSAGDEQSQTLEGFATSVISLCPMLVDAHYGRGDFKQTAWADLRSVAGLEVTILRDATLETSAEDPQANPDATYFSDITAATNEFNPNLRLSNGEYVADIDFDWIAGGAPPEIVEFGCKYCTGTFEQTDLGTFRCALSAYSRDGRKVYTYAIVRK